VTDFRTAYNRVERHIEERYGIPVSISDVLDPNTGDFDGARIMVDYDQDLESAFFILVHLFGHTVQWNLSEAFREIGKDTAPGIRSAEAMQRIEVYERDASRYSLKLMHEVGITDLDQWLSDWWWADWQYLNHFYRTGEKRPFTDFLKAGQAAPLRPLDIPPFTPTKWVSRWSF
jgi:hypothetical protein